jgi:CHAT domain-containing protein
LVSASKPVPAELILSAFPEARRVYHDLSLPKLRSADLEVCESAHALSAVARNITIYSSDTLSDCAFTRLSSPGWPDSSVFAGKQIIHLVAHGMFNANIPMASFIVTDPERGRVIRASDLLQIDLSQAELVVLSACQTGQIEVETGFEAQGFARALFSAGAKRSLLADWSIDDGVTSLFFGKLYSQIAKGAPIERAFQASVAYLSGRVRHPYLWAAFELYLTAGTDWISPQRH